MINDNFDNDSSVYSDEEYEQLGGYGKPIEYNNNNNNFEIELELSETLRNEEIIQKFVKNTKENYVELELNHKYDDSNMIFPTAIIKRKKDSKGWNDFKESVRKELKKYGINEKHINQILTVLTRNYKLVAEINNIVDNSDTDNQQQEQQKESEKIKTAELLLDLFNEQDPKPVLFKDQFTVPHVLINIYGYYQILPIEDTKFRRYLSKLYYDNLYEVPNSEAVKNVVHLLAAKAVFEGDTITLHLRTAWSTNYDNAMTNYSIYYDLSDEKNRCVKITADDGWTILDSQTYILFRRFNHQVPQVEPPLSIDDLDDHDDVLEQFIDLLNIKNHNDRLLLNCYIVSLFIPDIPQVILILLGEQGGAKSTLQELVRSLVDPSILKNLTFPSNENEFVQQLSHNYLVYYDNVSSIQEWISNLLCRAVTGSSLSKRALYTNDEDIYYSFMRKLGINGIDLAKINPDLSDRSITIKPGRIDKLDRVKINKIWDKFNALKPRLLGYIFNILSKVLKYKETHGEIEHPNGLNRMADWEEYAEIISRCMGNPDGKLQQVYQENINKQIDDAVASSQLCMAVIELVQSEEENKNNEWEERIPTELYEKLSDIAIYKLKFNNISNRKYWPQSPNSLTYNLNKVKTILREKGIEVITGVKNKDGVRIIKLIKLGSFSCNASKTSSTSSTSSKEDNLRTKQSENLDDLNIDNGETSSKTSSIENSQKQAQNSDSGRLDDQDDLFPKNETPEEKYRREQEEQKNWNIGLE